MVQCSFRDLKVFVGLFLPIDEVDWVLQRKRLNIGFMWQRKQIKEKLFFVYKVRFYSRFLSFFLLPDSLVLVPPLSLFFFLVDWKTTHLLKR